MVDFGRGGPEGAMRGERPDGSHTGGGRSTGGGPGSGSRGGGGDGANSTGSGGGKTSGGKPSGSPKGKGPKDRRRGRSLGNPNLSKNRRDGDFDPTTNPSGVHPDETDQTFGEFIADLLGFSHKVTVDPETRKRQSEIDGWNPMDSELLGGGLSLLAPPLGMAFGVANALRKESPLGFASSIMGGFGPTKIAGGLLGLSLEGAQRFGVDLDEELVDVIDSSVNKGGKASAVSFTGVNRNLGIRTSPPNKEGGKDRLLLANGLSTNMPQTADQSAISPKVSERYTQSRKLGAANIRRKEYAGQSLLGVLDSLGQS